VSQSSSWDKGGTAVDEATYQQVLADAIEALEEAGVRHVVVGGLASSLYGRPRMTKDIDVMVRPQDARAALEALSHHGFETKEEDPAWLYKGRKHGVIVDIIFKSSGDVYVDEEMLDRATDRVIGNSKIKVVAAEDLLVMKALAHEEGISYQWYDALGIIAKRDLDWEYVIRRAAHGPRRVLSLLLYAQSVDLAVPHSVIGAMFNNIYGEDAPG
jgi:predicted nucleotidyltransferase